MHNPPPGHFVASDCGRCPASAATAIRIPGGAYWRQIRSTASA